MIITDLKILRAPNEPVKPEEIEELRKKLEYELYSSKVPGVGLACPQIGINKKFAIIRIDLDNCKTSMDLANPIIIERKELFINKNEGCLSLPNVNINTYRFKEILVKDDLHPACFVATELDAVVIQHEIGHLEGILITNIEAKGKLARNDLCPCGSKIKYKKCCLR